MALRMETDCKGLYCGFEEGNCMSGDSTTAIRNATDCKGLCCCYEEGN